MFDKYTASIVVLGHLRVIDELRTISGSLQVVHHA